MSFLQKKKLWSNRLECDFYKFIHVEKLKGREAESNIDKNNKVVRSFASRKNISSGNNTYQHFAMIGLTFSLQ